MSKKTLLTKEEYVEMDFDLDDVCKFITICNAKERVRIEEALSCVTPVALKMATLADTNMSEFLNKILKGTVNGKFNRDEIYSALSFITI